MQYLLGLAERVPHAFTMRQPTTAYLPNYHPTKDPLIIARLLLTMHKLGTAVSNSYDFTAITLPCTRIRIQ